MSLLCALLLAACKRHDMYTQDKAESWDANTFFPDGATMRPAVAGTVARAEPDQDMPQPAAITMAMLDRGRQRYEIFCTPCHASSGDGNGMIVQRGFPRPPPLFGDRAEHASAASYYEAIGLGHGTMYGFAARVPSADRWAMVAYIRALQQSQDAQPGLLPPQDSAKLAAIP